MKQFILTLAVAFLFTAASAQERSNSEVKRDFEKEYKALLKSINAAETPEAIAGVGEKVSALESEYASHREFLNKALFPDDFDESIAKLKAQFVYSEQKIKAIGESAARIAELETQVATLTAEVNKLSGENTSLLAQLKEAKAERDELKKVVNTLRDNIAKRDKAIFALVDSLFMQYDKNIQPSGDVQLSQQSKLERSNVLTNIKKAAADNMEFLSSTLLSGSDVAKLYGEQRKFESNWNGVKNLIGNAYLSNKEKAREIPAIDTMIAEWRTRVDESFWKALNNLFSSAKLNVAPIMSTGELHNNIAKFMDDQITNSKAEGDADPYEIYSAFEKLWNEELKPVWVPVMKENNMITDANVADIDTKMQLWYSKVKPSNWLLYSLIGLLVVALAYILYGKMKKPATN
jgi:archaellum component FlaC